MKQVRLTSLYGAAVIALILFSVACKKSSGSSTAKLGTVVFQMNGKTYTSASASTDYGNELAIIGVGTDPVSKDSTSFELDIYDTVSSVSMFQGVYIDTARSKNCDITLTDNVTGYEYTDYYQGSLKLQVTSNSNGIVSGTFQGLLYYYTTSATPVDSAKVTNGSFSVQYN